MYRESAGTQQPTTIQEITAQIQTLEAERQALKARIHELNSHRWLTPEEQLERKRCQKLKLAKKDQIASLSRVIEV